MDFKKFFIVFLIFVSIFFLFGCTDPVACGDGVCQAGEEEICPIDCGEYTPKSGISITVVDEGGTLVPVSEGIFVEVLKKEELVDCTNPYFSSVCEMKTITLSANPQEIKFPSLLINSVDSVKIRVGATGYSIQETTIDFKQNELNKYTIVLEKQKTTTNAPKLPTNLKEGEECVESSQCYAGTNYVASCSADIYGVKRCNTNTTINPEINLSSCILDNTGYKVETNNGVCINDQEKLVCNGTEWSAPIFCNSGCRNGKCVEDYYDPVTKTFIFKKGQSYGLTLPVNPASNDINNIFSDAPIGTTIYKWMKSGDNYNWSMFLKSGRDKSFPKGVSIYPGEGFILKTINDFNFKFQGEEITQTTNKIKSEHNFIGIPTCANEYTFSKIVEEISAINPLCNTVSLQWLNKNGHPEWWSSDPEVKLPGKKVNLKVLPHEGIWVRCIDKQLLGQGKPTIINEFEWSPNCVLSKAGVDCKTFGFDEGTVECAKMDGNNCVEYSVVNCYKNKKFEDVWSKEGWDKNYEGTANFDTYGPFYYKKECNGLAENCVGATIEFVTGDYSGKKYDIKGYGLDLKGNVFQHKGISWVELDTNKKFKFDPTMGKNVPFEFIDWEYKLYGNKKPLPLPVCGNGIVEGNEQCDGGTIHESCTEIGFAAGEVGCNPDCTYNTNKCAPHLKDCNRGTCVITACEQLSEINNFRHRTDTNAIGGRYVLGNDLDCTGIDVQMIGDDPFYYTTTREFKGEFDGNGHTIKGLNFYRQYSGSIGGVPAGVELWWKNISVGLFKHIGGAGRVHDLTLQDVNVTGAVKVGGIAGVNEGSIERVKVNGTVKGSKQIGGIVGENKGTYGGTIRHVVFNGTVTGKDINEVDTGSIIGYCEKGKLVSPKVQAVILPRETTKYFGRNVGCELYHIITYDAFTFNGADAILKLRLGGNVVRTSEFNTKELITIHDADTDEVLVEFMHDFSYEDLNLIPVTVTAMKNYKNKNILFVENLKVQDTKTMFLEKLRPVSKAVCVLNEEVQDVNQLLKECTKLNCPGNKIIGDSNVSCLLDENKFTIFGLKYSGVVEEWECGDGWCDIDENSISCPSDCNEYCGNKICGQDENIANCPEDCANICGNKVCESGENYVNCPSDCQKPSGGSGGGSSSGGSSWPTRPITCRADTDCGQVSNVGDRYCVGSIVYQKTNNPTCTNPGRTDSNCSTIVKEVEIMECSNSQICTSGKCVEKQISYDTKSCSTNINCPGTQECLDGYCRDIVCNKGYYPKDHVCYCEGEHCIVTTTTDKNEATDGNLLNEETAQCDWFISLFWIFMILIIILIIGLFLWWFFIARKEKKEEKTTTEKPRYF